VKNARGSKSPEEKKSRLCAAFVMVLPVFFGKKRGIKNPSVVVRGSCSQL
jgi:hypothetical protein